MHSRCLGDHEDDADERSGPSIGPLNIYEYMFFFKKLSSVAALGLGRFTRAFAGCGELGTLHCGGVPALIVVASQVVEHRLRSAGFRSCGAQGFSAPRRGNLPGRD